MNDPYLTQQNDRPEPPDHLSEEVKIWWRETLAEFVLEKHHLKVFQGCGEAWDRAQAARRTVEREGITFEDRFGQPKVHPAVAVERKARDQFRLLLRELGLDVAPPNETPRGPKAPANAHRKA